LKNNLLNLSTVQDFEILKAEKSNPDVKIENIYEDNNLINYHQKQEFAISFFYKRKSYNFILSKSSYRHNFKNGFPKDYSNKILYFAKLNSQIFNSECDDTISFSETEKNAIFICLYFFESLDFITMRPELSPKKLPIKIQEQPWEKVFQIINNFEEGYPKCFCGHRLNK
jgi:hypothetical protein